MSTALLTSLIACKETVALLTESSQHVFHYVVNYRRLSYLSRWSS